MPATAFCFAGQARSLHIAPVWRSAQKHVFAVARHHRQTADLFAVLDANYTETHAVLHSDAICKYTAAHLVGRRQRSYLAYSAKLGL